MENERDILLEMKNISKSFPGVRALDEVSLTVRGGTVHALMGENGAGKSTLMKCLFGVYKKDSGRILIDGKEVEFKNAREALVGGVVNMRCNVCDKADDKKKQNGQKHKEGKCDALSPTFAVLPSALIFCLFLDIVFAFSLVIRC